MLIITYYFMFVCFFDTKTKILLRDRTSSVYATHCRHLASILEFTTLEIIKPESMIFLSNSLSLCHPTGIIIICILNCFKCFALLLKAINYRYTGYLTNARVPASLFTGKASISEAGSLRFKS